MLFWCQCWVFGWFERDGWGEKRCIPRRIAEISRFCGARFGAQMLRFEQFRGAKDLNQRCKEPEALRCENGARISREDRR